MSRGPITRAEALAWKAAYEAGATIEEIAWDNNVSSSAVGKHLRATGTEMRRAGSQAGKPVGNRSNHHAPEETPAALHVMFAGNRGAKRRRGGKRVSS